MPGNERITVYMLNNTNNALDLNNILARGSVDNDSGAEVTSDVMSQIGDPALFKTMARAVERTIGKSNATSDIVQDALVNMIDHAETFDWSKGSIISWGCRIASNLARNYRKASANRGHDSEANVGDDGDTIHLVDSLVGEDGRHVAHRSIERKALAAAISTLDQDSQTFLDAMAGGMGQCEAGALVGWSPATTTRRYKAITSLLSEKL